MNVLTTTRGTASIAVGTNHVYFVDASSHGLPKAWWLRVAKSGGPEQILFEGPGRSIEHPAVQGSVGFVSNRGDWLAFGARVRSFVKMPGGGVPVWAQVCAGSLYFAEVEPRSGPGASQTVIHRKPVGGGPLRTIARMQSTARAFACTKTGKVVVSRDDGIVLVKAGASEPALVVRALSRVSHSIAVDDQHVYFVDVVRDRNDLDCPGTPRRICNRSIESAKLRAAASVATVVTGQRDVTSLVVGGRYVYFVADGAIVRAPKTGGSTTTLVSADHPDLKRRGLGLRPVQLAFDRGFVYWADQHGFIARVVG